MVRGDRFHFRRVLYSIFLFFVRLFFRIMFRMEIKGEECVPRDESVVIVANHTSYIDPVVIGVASPQGLNYMAKKELFENILFRRLITLFKAFPLNRGAIDRRSLNMAFEILARKEPLLIFPAGTRNDRDDIILPAKAGIGMIIYKSKARVVPALIKGANNVLPRHAKFIHFRKLKVCFGKPLDLEKFFHMPERRETYELIAQEVTSNLKSLMQSSH